MLYTGCIAVHKVRNGTRVPQRYTHCIAVHRLHSGTLAAERYTSCKAVHKLPHTQTVLAVVLRHTGIDSTGLMHTATIKKGDYHVEAQHRGHRPRQKMLPQKMPGVALRVASCVPRVAAPLPGCLLDQLPSAPTSPSQSPPETIPQRPSISTDPQSGRCLGCFT